MKKKTKKRSLYFLIGTASLLWFFHFQNNSIVVSEYSLRSEEIPPSFDGYKVVQLSDLHNKSFGEEQSELVSKIEKENPDLIVFTGDLVDSNRYNENPSLTLMEKLVQLAPVYYVPGNHEWASGNFPSLEEKLKNIGVEVMRNTSAEISREIGEIQLIGIDDPINANGTYTERATAEKNIRDSIEGLEEEPFQILLSHRPEFFSLYQEYEFDLVFSGHAHGGQFRIPFVGGLIAPNQGLFPEYTSGEHVSDNTAMIVNRGLGNSVIPVRVFNRPEIVVVTLNTVE